MAMTATAGGGARLPGIFRLLIGLPLAAIVTVALFLVMRGLIFSDAEPPDRNIEAVNIEITSQRTDSDISIRSNRPQQPEEVRTPPPPPRIEAARAERPAEGLASTLGRLPEIQPEEVNQSDFEVVVSDRDEQPLVRLEPQYPRRAAERGLEGSCVVTFDVNPDGTTANISATCSSSMFERASIRAVERWRYQPRVQEGQAVVRRGLQVEFPFRLTE